jgi:hypothetical protein
MTKTPDYGMFTGRGNLRVHQLVTKARREKRNWAWLYAELRKLSEKEAYGEATDTAVREVAYDRLGSVEEDFYI